MGVDRHDTGENKADAVPEGEAPIQNTYTFWYIKRNAGNKAVRWTPHYLHDCLLVTTVVVF